MLNGIAGIRANCVFTNGDGDLRTLGPDLPVDADDAELEETYSNTNVDIDSPSRVIDHAGRLVGMVSLRDLNQAAYEQQLEWEQENEGEVDYGWTHEIALAEIMQPVNPHQFVSSSTTVLDAVQLFGSDADGDFYVLHISDVVGVLRYPHLFKPLGRLAFLALALEIEDQAQRLCSSHALAKSAGAR